MQTIVLGAGMTGIAAGRASHGVVYESCDRPGGLCASYYVPPGYRFEVGGGHWIFGGDPSISQLLRDATPMKAYRRRAALYFAKQQRYVPYPLQNHLAHLEPELAQQASQEMQDAAKRELEPARTMKDWLVQRFGPTLCDYFFYRFHELYTAGLYDRIVAQDDYKSPKPTNRGYNEDFVYPIGGLDSLATRLAEPCVVAYEKRAIGIDVQRREVTFADGSGVKYDALISTIALNRTLELAGLGVASESDPYTSVLVLNIGATRGPAFPDQHWLYVADAESGFHRIGFYSNVDRSFVPTTNGRGSSRESLYVERAFEGGAKPDALQTRRYTDAVIRELRQWSFIDEVEVVDATWIDVAYTWSWPGSEWRREALQALDDHRIHAVGRYGRWIFQGIADSIRDGLTAGARLGRG
jgi:protoporphyrinogen oxidase